VTAVEELVGAGTRGRHAAYDVPLVFTGDDGFTAAELRGTSVAEHTDAAWADQVVTGLWPGERALVALSFAPGGRGVAHRVVPLPGGPAARDEAVARHRVRAVPTPAAYADQVRAALGRIADGQVDKLVLGRCLEAVSHPPLRPATVVAGLLSARPGRYVFSLPLDAAPDAPVLLGASPELLVRRRGALVASTPLAGSVPRSADPAEDGRRAEALQDSAKDLAEHAYVVDAIVAALRDVCVEIDAPARPQLLSTDMLHHLATPIRARLAGDGPSALRLAQLLHPTPAVGGVPTTAALAAITELEGDLRGPLAGAVGWVDGRGDGELAVTIRAGVLDGERLRLFAGAGIVAGSDPELEVRETAAKLATMAHAVGLDLAGEVVA